MKNKILWAIVLILLPLGALGLASMPDSVTAVVSPEKLETLSFFGTLADGSRPVGLGFAGILCVVIAVLAAVGAVSKKAFWNTLLQWMAMGAAILAVLPLLLRTEPLVIPNVGVSLLLCVEALVAYLSGRSSHKAEAVPQDRRLK